MPDIPQVRRIFGEALQRTAQTVGNIILDIRQDMYNAESQNQYAQGVYEMKTQFGQFMTDLASDPDYMQFGNKWDTYQKNLYENITKNISIPEARQQFDAAFMSAEGAMRIDVERASRRIQVEQMLSQHITRFDNYIADGDVPAALAEIVAMEKAGLIYPAEAEEYRKQAITVGNYNRYYSIASAMPSDEGWQWILVPENAPELTPDQRTSISNALYSRMARMEAQKQAEWNKKNEEDLRRVMTDINVHGKRIAPADLYDKTKYALTISQANAIYQGQIDLDNAILEAKWQEETEKLEAKLEFEEEKEAIELELLEKQLSIKSLHYQLTIADVEKITVLDSKRGEYWRKVKVSQDDKIERMSKERQEDIENLDTWYTITSDLYENMHDEKILDKTVIASDHIRWIQANVNDPENPWDEARTPRISANRAFKMIEEVEKVHKEWGRQGGLDIIKKHFDGLIDQAEDTYTNEEKKKNAVTAIITSRVKLMAEYNLLADKLETQEEMLDKARELVSELNRDNIRKLIPKLEERTYETEPGVPIDAGTENHFISQFGKKPDATTRTTDGDPAFKLQGVWYVWAVDRWRMSDDDGQTWRDKPTTRGGAR